jgi:anthranilate phosphoribosyltransferase
VIENRILEPASLGIPPYPLEALAGGDAAANTRALADLLDGRAEPAYAWSVALNTGALLWIAGRSETLREGVERAHATVETGAARKVLTRLQEVASRA